MATGNFGERLKRERELREVSPNEVVVATRISLRFLEALENEDWDQLPGGIFNRGFVRAIAVYGWRRYSAYRHASQSSAVVLQPLGAAQPVPSPAGDPPRANSAALNLSVSTSAATRVRILADGKVVLDSEIPAGQNRHFSAETAFEVTAADSSAVLLELNGQTMLPVSSPGASGTIVLSQKDLRPAPGGNSQP